MGTTGNMMEMMRKRMIMRTRRRRLARRRDRRGKAATVYLLG